MWVVDDVGVLTDTRYFPPQDDEPEDEDSEEEAEKESPKVAPKYVRAESLFDNIAGNLKIE